MPETTEVPTFKPGDVVKLKAGGPAMTISYVEKRPGFDICFTQWFGGTTLYDGEFEVRQLVKVEDTEADDARDHKHD